MNAHNWAARSRGGCLQRDTLPCHKQLIGPVRFLGKHIPLASIADRELHRERGNSTAERTNSAHLWGKLEKLLYNFFLRRGPCFDFISKYANNNCTGQKTFTVLTILPWTPKICQECLLWCNQYMRDLHTTETTGNEQFPIGRWTNYFPFCLRIQLVLLGI